MGMRAHTKQNLRILVLNLSPPSSIPLHLRYEEAYQGPQGPMADGVTRRHVDSPAEVFL